MRSMRGANFSGCWFSMGSGFCCCSTTIKPLGNAAALPASSFTRSCCCITEVTAVRAAARSSVMVSCARSRSLEGARRGVKLNVDVKEKKIFD